MSKAKISIGLVAVVIVAILVVHGEVFGVPSGWAMLAGQAAQGQLGEPWVSIMAAIGGLISFLQVIALVALWMLQYMLSTEFFNDPVMMANLRQIWMLSRDIMNVIFALMLIGVAIYTIITANKDKITQNIVRFATAVILVNFSWFFPRVIIDVANILTATVYSIPNMLPGFTCEIRDETTNPPTLKQCEVVTDVIVLPSLAEEVACTSTPAPAAVPGAPPPQKPCQCFTGLVCYTIASYDTAKNTLPPSHAMINGLAVSFARITTLAKVPASVTGAPAAGTNQLSISLHLMISSILALVFILAATLPLVGLAIGLIIRVVIIWVTVAFMPFVFIGYVLNGKLGVPFLEGNDIWKNFIDAAFLPAIVAIPYAIGFVMMSTTAKIPSPDGTLLINVPLIHGVKTWWGLMWQAAAIGIIYVGAFAALKRNALIGQFTGKIEGFGNSIAGAASQLPLLIPLPLPKVGGGIGLTVGQVRELPGAFNQAIRTAAITGTGFKGIADSVQTQFGKGGTPGGIIADPKGVLNDASNKNTKDIVQAIKDLGSLTGAAHAKKLEDLAEIARKSSVTGARQLTRDNVLPALQKIALAQSSSGALGSQRDAIQKAIDNGKPPATPPPAPAPPPAPKP